MRIIWKINSRTHHVLINIIKRCAPIDVILEKRCINFLWSLFKSRYVFYRRIVKMSFTNMSSTVAKNVYEAYQKKKLYYR